MAGTFSYTESTNIIVVTGGTSGAPATFNDMYTADQAGTGTVLLAAIAGSATNTLTYAIRPTHDKALVVKCIVAGKTTEADYIFITGTDAWGTAQTESIDVSAGNASYTSTKKFATITNIDCSDNSAGEGTVWEDGTISVTQDIWGVVWETVTDAQYKIDCNIEIGDGSTSTYFTIVNEMIYSAGWISTKAEATLIIGSEGSASGIAGYGAYVQMVAGPSWSNAVMIGSTAIVKIYNSVIRWNTTTLAFRSGYIYIYNSIFTSDSTARAFVVSAEVTSGEIDGMTLYNSSGMSVKQSLVTTNRITVDTVDFACQGNTGDTTLKDLLATNTITADLRAITGHFIKVVDPRFHLSNVIILDADGVIYEQYTCNIHVNDADGNNLAGVTVTCTDQASGEEFSVDTDANGDIAEQTIDYKKWSGTSETLTSYSPHVFTLSKTDYETLELNAITVDHPIVWNLELQAPASGGSVNLLQGLLS